MAKDKTTENENVKNNNKVADLLDKLAEQEAKRKAEEEAQGIDNEENDGGKGAKIVADALRGFKGKVVMVGGSMEMHVPLNGDGDVQVEEPKELTAEQLINNIDEAYKEALKGLGK